MLLQSKSSRTFSVVALVLAFGAMTGAARADGLFDFFQQLGGDAPAPTSQPLPQPDFGDSGAPALTVRRKPHHHRMISSVSAGTIKMTAAELKDVTIYTDKTLARGDAVMTKAGMRVFNGSTSWPYKDEDFVALSSNPKLPAAERKELGAMDLASRMIPRD